MQVATVMHPMQHAGGVATYYATPGPTHPHYSSVSTNKFINCNNMVCNGFKRKYFIINRKGAFY